MKRIIFCFDGTWNRLDANNVTNVVHTARNIALVANDGIHQIVHYDQGVGTKPHEKIRGGVFGMGLMDNLEEAYRFLVFNYEHGDEIFLFGFSRGAYSARSFAGLIFNCGIVNDVKRIPKALKLYKTRQNDDKHMVEKFRDFRLECSPYICVDQTEFDWRVAAGKCEYHPVESGRDLGGLSDMTVPNLGIINIKYIGVWDTVGALGVPKTMSIASVVNRRHQFHDCKLSTFVASARHAVAIDETRRSFEPTLWTNVDDMNKMIGFHPASEKAPYQQQWFPGVHGAVGGGGDYTGLSDEALEWIWEGAKRQGLQFSISRSESLYDIRPNFADNIANMDPPKWYRLKSQLTRLLSKQPRSFIKVKKEVHDIRPVSLHEISMAARYRWKADGNTLTPKGAYRPLSTLDRVVKQLDGWSFAAPARDETLGDIASQDSLIETKSSKRTHIVVRGDTLGAIAKTYLGSASKYPIIFAANQPMLTDPDRIYPGQILKIPVRPSVNPS